MSESTLLAVYGSLRMGHGNHDYFLSDSTFIGTSWLGGWVMYDLGWFPGVQESGNDEDKILVEIYEVDSTTLEGVDGLEGANNEGTGLYKRRQAGTRWGNCVLYECNSIGGSRVRVTHGDWSKWVEEVKRHGMW